MRPDVPPPPPDLTQAILARTSGDPCRHLEALACDFVDGSLDTPQADLVRLHLTHCHACTALVTALRTLQATLPALAQADPGPGFNQAVLRATQGVRPALPPPMADLGALWRRLLHRPRIALETAYLGAAAGLVGFYLPTPLPELAHRVPAMVQPLSDSAQQAAKKVVQAECRTALSLGRRLEPLVKPRLDPQAARTLWRQAAYRTRAWLRRFRPPPSPTPKPPSETPPPANPG